MPNITLLFQQINLYSSFLFLNVISYHMYFSSYKIKFRKYIHHILTTMCIFKNKESLCHKNY